LLKDALNKGIEAANLVKAANDKFDLLELNLNKFKADMEE